MKFIGDTLGASLLGECLSDLSRSFYKSHFGLPFWELFLDSFWASILGTTFLESVWASILGTFFGLWEPLFLGKFLGFHFGNHFFFDSFWVSILGPLFFGKFLGFHFGNHFFGQFLGLHFGNHFFGKFVTQIHINQ